MNIRLAKPTDIYWITKIYNQAIHAGNATGDKEVCTEEEKMNWLIGTDRSKHPVYIIEDQNQLLGYIYLSPYRSGREALRGVAEVSYYIDYNSHGRGIGSRLLNHVVSLGPELGIEHLLAILMDINEGSIALLKKFEFTIWGRFPNIVTLGESKCDHVIYGRHL